MKAVYINEFGGREKLIYTEDFKKPEPQEGEVLVRIKSAGVNPVDYKIREGIRKNLPHNFPIVLGWDMSGIVEATGFGARRYKEGDEVFAYARRPCVEKGTYAEYIALPECYITAKPRTLSFCEAASVPLAGLTAYQAVHDKANLRKGQIALILGASGGVGSFAVQLAKIAGAEVVTLAGLANNDYLVKLGADHLLNYNNPDWVAEFIAAYPQKADVVFDFYGKETLFKAHHCVRSGAQLVSIAGQADKELIASLDIHFQFHFVEPNVTQLNHLSSLFDSGKLSTHINSEFLLHETAKAHEKIETEHTKGKIVLSI
jgi:NADPH:quinone reductase-like Zn-dependent oxidoreductase